MNRTASQMNALLLQRIEAVVRHLLPGGQRTGAEYHAGSLQGDAGDSLRVRLEGEKAGVWSDFTTGETGGDLLDLWAAVRGADLAAAMREVVTYLGLTPYGQNSQPRRAYRRPPLPPQVKRLSPDGPVMAYFKTRGLTEVTLTAFKIAEQPGAIKFPNLPDNPATIVFPYLRDGERINFKYLALARPNGKKQTLQEAKAEPCLFGWQTNPPQARSAVICEGEGDAMTWYQMGFPALSVPMGGGGGKKQDWIESEFDRLAQFDVIYISTDMDEAGRAAAADILQRLGPERCRVVELPHKDANECLMAGAAAADFQRWIHTAVSRDPEELRPADRYMDDVVLEFYPDPSKPPGVPTPWPKVGDNLRFRRAETTLWYGYGGHGKSLALNHLAASSLAGGDARWCIASMEMKASRTLWRLVKQLTGQRSPPVREIERTVRWLGDKLWLFDLVGTARVERMLEVFAYAVRRYQIRHFIVDSLAKCGMGEDDYNGQKMFVEQLVNFGHQHDCHVHLVSHARKGNNEDTPPNRMDVKGTGALTDLVDNVIGVWRNKPKEAQRELAQAEDRTLDPDIARQPDTLLTVSKQRHTGWEGRIQLWFEPESWQYLEQPNAPAVRYAPEEEPDHG